MFPRYLIVLLTLCAAASGQVCSSSADCSYYFRQVLLVANGGNVAETQTGFGTLTFKSDGTFTINGQKLVGTNAPAALTGSGTYTFKAGGITTLSSPLRPGTTVNARLGVGALVGSSTEAGPTVFDLFLAIPATSLGSLNGPYW